MFRVGQPGPSKAIADDFDSISEGLRKIEDAKRPAQPVVYGEDGVRYEIVTWRDANA